MNLLEQLAGIQKKVETQESVEKDQAILSSTSANTVAGQGFAEGVLRTDSGGGVHVGNNGYTIGHIDPTTHQFIGHP